MKDEDSLVSVLMPVRNGGAFFADALQSVLNQSHRNIEVLIVDDGSTDGTVEEVLKGDDARVKLLFNHTPSTGIVGALNTGLANANGEFVARMDADDICEPDRISRLVTLMRRNPHLAVCGSTAQKFGNTTGRLRVPSSPNHIRAYAIFHSPFIHPSVMIRKSTMAALNNQYEDGFDLAEDYRLWTRLLLNGDGLNLRKSLLKYRVHTSQHSLSKFEARKNSVARIQSHWLTMSGINTDDIDLALHTELVTDVSYLSRNPRDWKAVFSLYRNLYRANSNTRPRPFSRYWLLTEIFQTLLLQALYALAVTLKLRSISAD